MWNLFALLTVSLASAHAFDIEAHKITDSMVAAYTPMKNDGKELDLERIPAYAEYISKINITNVMPAGSNGESLSLTVSERKALAAAWAKAGKAHGLHIYMHIGSESLMDAMELAAHAASTEGISGIVCMTPVYFKPTLQTLHDFLAAVAGAAPKLPFWFYHFPDDTGVLPGKAHEVLDLVDKSGKIPNFMGIKYTDYNLMDFDLCLQLHGRKYNMLYGRDEQALAALELGAAAAVSSTMQYSSSLRDVVTAFRKGDKAGALTAQEKNARLCSMFGAYETVGKNVQKNIMKMAGMDVGPSRLPKIDLGAEEYKELEEELLRGEYIEKPKASSRAVVV